MKDRLGKQIFKNIILYFLLIIIIEILVRINIHIDILNYALIRIVISSLILSSVLALLTSFFSNKVNKVLRIVISFLLALYAWVQINLFNYLGFFMGIGNAEQGTKIVDYIKDFIQSSKIQSYFVFVPFILITIYEIFLSKRVKEYKLSKTYVFNFKIESHKNKILTRLSILLIIILLNGLYFFTFTLSFMQNKLQTISNKELLLSNDNSNLSVSQFGVYVYGISDIIVNTFNIEYESDYTFSNNNFNNNEVETDYNRVIDDSSWNALIENETSSTYNKLNNYFINREITPKNDKTGIYKDKNLIVILMESVNYIAINEERYPTIYKLWSEGTSFRNNYSPKNNCSTGNNEMTVMTSLFTINHTCTANKYKKNVYPESIFNMFNNIGYSTSSYHDYIDHYYSRKTIHKNMGSGAYYNAQDLGIKWSSVYEEWPSDVDLIKTSTPKFINEDKFMVFLSTVTTHQTYNVHSEYGDKNLDKLTDADLSTTTKRYMSKMYELEYALKLLLEELEAAGKLEDTVIAMFADHYPYGLSNKQINSVLDYDVNVNNEVDRTPMIIYNAGQEPEIVEDYTSIIDLLPTLLNMFDINYDPRLYLGRDIFSDYEHRTYFYDGSWQDEKGFYNSSKGKFIPKDENVAYTDEKIVEINKEIALRQSMSSLAIKNDYFNYLFKGLEKYNVVDEEIESGEINESSNS